MNDFEFINYCYKKLDEVIEKMGRNKFSISI